MLSEIHRISQLAKKRDPNAHPSSSRRLPVAKITPEEYTEQPILRKIITIYKNKLQNHETFPKPTPLLNTKALVHNPENPQSFDPPKTQSRIKQPSRSPLTKFKQIPNLSPSPTNPNSTSTKIKQNTNPRQNTDQLTIIFGHGRFHPYYSYLPRPAILVDINPVARPDILGDMLSKKFMERFPTNYFDQVILMYTRPPHSFHPLNQQLWKNLHRLLKPQTGQIKSYYIHKAYTRKFPNSGKEKFQEELYKLAPTNLFDLKISGSMIILTKK